MKALKTITSNDDVSKIKYNFYVFDTETTCLEPQPKNFVFGVIYGYNRIKVLYSVEEFIEEFSSPKYKNKHMFAHNAEFDLLSIFGNVFLKVDSAAIFNGKFIAAKFKDLTFADSMNIFPASVEKLGNIIGLPKLDNDKTKTNKLKKENITDEDISYCIRDCEIVYKSLLRAFELVGVIRLTQPSLAMYDFRHQYLEKDLMFSDLVEEFHESYYGGRTEAFRIGKVDAKVYDINSMYPFIMTKVVIPDIKRLKKVTKCDTKFLLFCLEHYEGMAKITVIHKPTYFGYLPMRAEINKIPKLVFPVGEFTTTVNFNELRFAVKQGVVEIKEVFFVIYGNPVKSIFTDYIHDNFKKRIESNNEIDKLLYKLKMNSLYGKFGMRAKFTTTYYEQVPYNLIAELKEADKYVDIKLFSAIRQDCFLVTENEQLKASFFAIPTISSYITSEARIMLLKNLLANENNEVCYCDTDSIFLSGKFIGNISNNLGDFKLEEKKITEVRGLKNYSAINEFGEKKDIIKGISKNSIEKKTASGKTTYETKRYYKSKASLRNKKEAGLGYTVLKTISGNYDKRAILEDGNTTPLICKDDVFINAPKFIKTSTKKKSKNNLIIDEFIYDIET